VYIQLVRKDDTILNCQKKKIFIEDVLKKKKQKAMKRLAQSKRFNNAKQVLKQKIKNGSTDSGQEKQDAAQENEEDLLDGMTEDGMIFFYD